MVWNCFLFNKVLCDSQDYQLPYVPLSPKWFFIWEIKMLGKKGGGCGDGGSTQVQKCDRNVRKVPNFTPLRHNSYTALNGFGYERRRGSPTQSSARNKMDCGSALKVFTYYQKKEEEGWWEQNIWKSRSSWSNNL